MSDIPPPHWQEQLPPFWRELAHQVLFPKAAPDDSEDKLEELRHRLPIPVIWLLGKAQAGKTSIVSVLTGREDAEIGNGFKACTQTAQIYDYPATEDCLLKFLDTRGLGEVSYDPSEDLQQFQQQAHMLMVVLRAMDHNQSEVLSALHEIRKAHPEWPVLVVQTALHEGYPNREFEHPQPYPFNDLDHAEIPDDLRRSLQVQRAWFVDIPQVAFVAVDLTPPEEAYQPQDYGAEALWTALLDDSVPQAMRKIFAAMHSTGKNRYTAAAHPHIIAYALMATAAEAIPVPLVALPVVLSAQAKMFQTIASIYDQALSYERFVEIAGLLGSGYLLRLGGREVLKLIPVYGTAVAAAYAGATTYALGHLLCMYFEHVREGKSMNQAEFERAFADNMERAKALISKDVLNNKTLNR